MPISRAISRLRSAARAGRLARGCRVLPAALGLLALAGCDLSAVFDVFRSFEAVCERRLPPLAIRVVPEPVAYRVDRSLDYAALTRKGAAIAADGQVVLGLTEASLGYQLAMSARGMASRASGKYCMRPEVEVKVGFNPMTVYMGADAREGSCVDRLVWEHELKHVAVYQEYLGRFASEAESELRRAFGARVQVFASAEDGQRHVDETTAKLLQPLLERSMAEVRALQKRVDSAEEYARVGSLKRACGE